MMKESRQGKGTSPTGGDEWDGWWRIDPRPRDKIALPERCNAGSRGRFEAVHGAARQTVPPSAIGSRPGFCPDQPALLLRTRAARRADPDRHRAQLLDAELSDDRPHLHAGADRIALTEPIYRDLLFRSLYISLVVSIA